MKEDPNYSCSEEPGGEISNQISLNLPATAGSCPIRKHNLDGSRCLEQVPKRTMSSRTLETVYDTISLLMLIVMEGEEVEETWLLYTW